MALQKGSRFGVYRIEAPISSGGMGAVYRAVDEDLERTVALKVMGSDLSSDLSFRKRFEREARLAARVAHPNIATVYSRGDERGRLWIAMQYVSGQDLGLMLRAGAMDPGTAVGMLRAVAGALDAVHSEGIVHRDVKPANIVLSDREGSRVYLVDFGIAHAGDATRFTQAGAVVGTPGFIAPERLRGESGGPASDLYSLGCVAYEMLTGRPPFHGPPAVIYARQLEGRVAPLPESLRHAQGVLDKALAQLPEHRYASAGHLVDALAEALGRRVSRDSSHEAREGGAERTRSRREDAGAVREQQRSRELAVLLDAASRLPGRRLQRELDGLLREGESPAVRRAVAAALPTPSDVEGHAARQALDVLRRWAGQPAPRPRPEPRPAPPDPPEDLHAEFEKMVRRLGAEGGAARLPAPIQVEVRSQDYSIELVVEVEQRRHPVELAALEARIAAPLHFAAGGHGILRAGTRSSASAAARPVIAVWVNAGGPPATVGHAVSRTLAGLLDARRARVRVARRTGLGIPAPRVSVESLSRTLDGQPREGWTEVYPEAPVRDLTAGPWWLHHVTLSTDELRLAGYLLEPLVAGRGTPVLLSRDEIEIVARKLPEIAWLYRDASLKVREDRSTGGSARGHAISRDELAALARRATEHVARRREQGAET